VEVLQPLVASRVVRSIHRPVVLASELLALSSGEASEDDSHAITPESMKGTLGCQVMRGPRIVPHTGSRQMRKTGYDMKQDPRSWRTHVGRRVGAAGYGSGRVGYWLADDVEGLAAPVEIGFVSGCARI
jgi:hypothetical protein